MGNFYTNFTLRGPNPQAVLAALSGRSALVTPTSNGSVVVFDEESDSQNSEVISQLGAHLSSSLNSPVLAVLNHDDDVFFYQLFELGAQIDEYCSVPGYFSGEDLPPSGGDARKLCTAFSSSNIAEVEAILHPEDDLPAFAMEQHDALVRALGISNYGVGCGFTYVSEGELPGNLAEEDLLKA